MSQDKSQKSRLAELTERGVKQHMDAVEEVVASHALWCPKLSHVWRGLNTRGNKTTVVLNDGRHIHVHTFWRHDVMGSLELVTETQTERTTSALGGEG